MKITNLYALATYVITLSLRMRKSDDVHIVVIIFNKDIHKKLYFFKIVSCKSSRIYIYSCQILLIKM